MKLLRVLAVVNLCLPIYAKAEISSVTIKKVSRDLYQTTDGSYIETNNCFADAKGTEAVLKFKKYACHNNLRFSEETICEVLDVFK